jgi:ABC-type sugar transport system permease subunit
MTSSNSNTPLIPPPPQAPPARKRTFAQHLRLSTQWLILIALMLPTLVGKLIFDLWPKFSAIQMSFYQWDGALVREFIGVQNYIRAFTQDPLFWQTFWLIGILITANLIKMWPSILIATVIHRIKSEKSQYLYRVLFVIPMVIPGLVWLLVWKSFYEPTYGLFNQLLRWTGLMNVLQWMDVHMPILARFLQGFTDTLINPWAGSHAGIILLGLGFLVIGSVSTGTGAAYRAQLLRRWPIMLGWIILTTILIGPIKTATLAILICVPSYALLKPLGKFKWPKALRAIGAVTLLLGLALILLTDVWHTPTNAFAQGQPAWLGHTKLVIPAILFWGFPWVGTLGVLLYLAGLQSISKEVYEAADLDGAGPIKKFFSLELPLILSQVRINLVFMTIGTLTDYGLILVLLGSEGGPSNVGMTPGLYMYREAFVNQRFGYACALGMVLFVCVLGMTIVYQKYVRVDK